MNRRAARVRARIAALRAEQHVRGNVIGTRSETLGPEDIHPIYTQALEQALP